MSENNVNSTEEIVLSVEMGDAVSAQTAEAYAVGKRGGVDVAETDPTWHNNAKYYAEQAEEAAGEAQGAEEAAQRAEAAQAAAEAAQAQAAGSAETAGQQAAAAAGSAQDAATAKTGAETAQSAAAGSATAAEGSAGRASQSATAAAGSATAAGTAKTAAETARDAAAGSATAAAGSASAADQSAQAAAASAQAAEDVAESIPADYSQLSDDVSGLKSAFQQSVLKKLTLTYTNYDGKYIKNDGGMATDNVTHTSDLVPVVPGQTIAFENVPLSADFWCFGFYNSSTPSAAASTGKYSYNNNTKTDKIVTVPSGSAYMVYSYPANATPGDIYIGNASLITNIEPQQAVFFERKNLFSIYADNLIGRYYDATNTLKTAAAYGQSDLIPVAVGNVYSSTETGFNVNFYASDGSFVSSVSSSTYNTNKKVTVPSGASFARFGFTVAQIDSFEVLSLSEDLYTLKPEYLPYEDDSDEQSPYDGMNGVAFGTSITYRAQTTGGYLQFLPALSGITFDNQGVGSSAILNPSGDLNMLEKIKGYTGYANKDVVIIEGFVNDWYGQKTLGAYTDNTETTVCGCLRSAINYVYSQNAKVTMFVIFDHYGRNYNNVDESSTAVRGGKTQYEFYEEMAKVCASLGIKTIKLYEMAEFSELTPQYFLDDIHPNGLGAEHEANKIWSVMKTYAPNINT